MLPSFLHVALRKLKGDVIGKGVKIKIGTLILTRKLTLGDHVKLGPFCVIRSEQILIENNTLIKPLTLVSAKNISIGSYVQIAPLAIISGDFTPKSKLIIGEHSRIFPFCWIDTGEGVTIGKHVGIGGHTLIFTHGVWSNYLEGGPVTFGEVIIEDEVWLPWRVFVMPNVVIGKKTVVGANSVVTKSCAANSLIAGSPAKVLKENFIRETSMEEKENLLKDVFKAFVEYKADPTIRVEDNKIMYDRGVISSMMQDLAPENLIIILEESEKFLEEKHKYAGYNYIYHPVKIAFISQSNETILDFISFLRRYGIRLSLN